MVLDLEQKLGNRERRATPNMKSLYVPCNTGILVSEGTVSLAQHGTCRSTPQTSSLVEDTNNLGYLNQSVGYHTKPQNQKLNYEIHLGDSLIIIFVSKAAAATLLFLHKI